MPFQKGQTGSKKGASGRKTKAEELAKAIEMGVAVERMKKELAKVQNAMDEKDLSKEQYETLRKTIDTLVKNIQLLSGNATENIKYTDTNYERAIRYIKGSSEDGVPE